MSTIDYSSSVIWISQKTSLALRASHEQDSLARLQNPVAPGYRTRLSLHAAVTHYFLVNFDIQLLRSLISFCGSNFIFKVGNHCVIIGTLWLDRSASLHCLLLLSCRTLLWKMCQRIFWRSKKWMQVFRFGAKLSDFHLICYFYYTVWLSDRTLWILYFSQSKLCTFYVLG